MLWTKQEKILVFWFGLLFFFKVCFSIVKIVIIDVHRKTVTNCSILNLHF